MLRQSSIDDILHHIDSFDYLVTINECLEWLRDRGHKGQRVESLIVGCEKIYQGV